MYDDIDAEYEAQREAEFVESLIAEGHWQEENIDDREWRRIEAMRDAIDADRFYEELVASGVIDGDCDAF